MTIPPPTFQTINCTVKCCLCSENCVLYWVKDTVWEELKAASNCCGGHVCVTCAEKHLVRQLTLEDLEIEYYKRTAANETSVKRVIHCVVDTVMGAAKAAKVSVPTEWCYMWEEYHNLGKKLAEQTANPAEVVQALINKTKLEFPDFKNPYL